MAVVLDEQTLDKRINTLRSGFAGRAAALLARNRALLRAYSPEFDQRLGEFDQWPDPILSGDAGKTRSSFNLARAVPEIWAALEASELPALRWFEGFIPTPVPDLDQTANEQREQTYRAAKLVGRQIATIREQTLQLQARRARLLRHFYRGVLRKNVYGHSWLKSWPDLDRKTFRVVSKIDNSSVYPVWSAWDDHELDAVLVAYRRSAARTAEQYPQADLRFLGDGLTIAQSSYYQPTPSMLTDADRAFVWVEDYWTIDRTYSASVADDGEPVSSLVVNAIRVNGKMVSVSRYPGWKRIPYFLMENENGRDEMGFSDVGTTMPIQDGLNRFLSQEQDVIGSEANPKFKYRGDADRSIELENGTVVSLDHDEDIEQIAVSLNMFPNQVHFTQYMDILGRVTGLPDTTWGRVTSAQNSGRALSTAWRAVAARMVPRTLRNTQTLEELLYFWLDCMELYDWESARDLYNGNRDFAQDWPNKEPRDASEVVMEAINKYNAGAFDLQALMEATGENSPDIMIERVRAEFLDTVLHPEKAQSYIMLTRLQQQIEIEAEQAGIQAQTAQAQLEQLGSTPPGQAPGPSTEQQAAAAAQARAQAAQQAAPAANQGQNQPAPGTQAGQVANAVGPPGTSFRSVVNNGGNATNRLINRGSF